MRPVREIDPVFYAADEPLVEHLPLLDRYVARVRGARPLAGYHALLVQHQLSNQVPMVRALLDLGLDPRHIWWLDIPYTSNGEVREYVHSRFGLPKAQLAVSRFNVFDAYAPYQHGRATQMLLAVIEAAGRDAPLLVLDDGAYILEAIASLAPARRPTRVAVVEQTTRGFIKLGRNAMLRRTVGGLPLVDVARSVSKRTLEPPFIAMAVCAAMEPHLQRHCSTDLDEPCLVLGYGAIGEQVASFVRHRYRLPKSRVAVYDRDPTRIAAAQRRGYPIWSREDLDTRFSLVVGCSGEASFAVGDSAYLAPSALLVSASSGAVELSRQDFIELAEATPGDDVELLHDGVDPHDVHANLRVRLPESVVTFVNGGFPVNFSGRRTVCPTRYIQPTTTMMIAAAVQTVTALESGAVGVIGLDPEFCRWVSQEFRGLLGDRAAWLEPVPDAAW